jgi:ASC-1-like (ASCH) protein
LAKSTLHLNLYRKYFDEILAGKKVIEYRQVTPYWSKRLESRYYDVIQFRNGYAKVAPIMVVAYEGFYIENEHYCLPIGKILHTENI